MEYNGPFDQPGSPDAPYVNGNPATGTQGSIPPAAAFEFPQRELINFFADNLLVPTNDDLHQLSKAYQNGAVIYGADTGTANSVVVALNPVPDGHVPGMTVRVKKGPNDNSGPMTLNIGLGSDTLVKANGAAFSASDMPANMVFEATWDGTRWQTINYIGVQSSTQTIINNFVADIPYTVDTSVTPNSIIAPFSPAITSMAAGKILEVKLNRSFTGGAVTMIINALPSINVKRGDGSNPIIGDGTVGQILLLLFDGTNLQIVNSVVPAKPLPVLIADLKPLGTNAGSFSSGAWRTRDLNTFIADPFGLNAAGLVTLANNRFTLAPGKWLVECHSFNSDLGTSMIRLMNMTDSTQVIRGQVNCQTQPCPPFTFFNYLHGYVDINASKAFEIQLTSKGQPRSSWGMGISWAQATATSGSPTPPEITGEEVYTILKLEKVS